MKKLQHSNVLRYPYGHHCLKEYVLRKVYPHNLEYVKNGSGPHERIFKCTKCGNLLTFINIGSTCEVMFRTGERADFDALEREYLEEKNEKICGDR